MKLQLETQNSNEFVVKLTICEDFEIDCFRKDSETITQLCLPNGDVLIFSSSGKSSIISAQSLKNLMNSKAIIEKNKTGILYYLDFVHTVVHNLKSADRKASKKKLNKKDLEKLILLKEEILQNGIKELIEKKQQLQTQEEHPNLKKDKNSRIRWFIDECFANNDLFGVHNFDLFAMSYAGVDFFGRKYTNSVKNKNKMLPKVDYKTAISLFANSQEKLSSMSDIRSTTSSTKKYIYYELENNPKLFSAIPCM